MAGPAKGAYSAPPSPLAGFERERNGEGGRKLLGGKENGREWK